MKINLKIFKSKKTFDINDKKLSEIINSKDIEKQYSLVYDYICDYIDNDMASNNYCDFQEGQCIANRLKKSAHEQDGCCYRYKKGLCEYLKNGDCTIKSITCKLFICEYLESKGVKYNLKEIMPIDTFLNKKQQRILKKRYFRPKDEVIRELIKHQ